MKLLLDQGLPRSTADLLRDSGVDAIHVGEIGLSSAADPVILLRAADEQRCIITLDADFHAQLALSAATGPSVVRVRIEGLRAMMMSKLIRNVIEQCGKEIEHGAVVTV